jgi:L-amino acid N-acyltransferase YncA
MSLQVTSFAPGAPLPEAFAALHRAQGYQQKDEALWPGAEAALALRDRAPVGRLSLALAPSLRGLERKAGVLGHYEAMDAEAGAALLSHGLARLKALGAEVAIGPLNGSTWHRYRLALPGAAGLPFPGEPENQARYAQDFSTAGFSVLEHYESRSIDLRESSGEASVPDKVKRRWQGRSRALRLDRYDEELEAIYRLSVQAFDSAVLYTPVSRDEFLALYRPLKALYDPELVRLVEDERGELLGYMVSYPHQGRVILKTLACRADARGSGLAAWLIVESQALGRAKGCQQAIHALMHVDNRSASISRRWSEPFRRYALYSKDLAL